MVDYDIMLIRINTIDDEISKLLAANAANAAYIDKYLNKIRDRLEVLHDDVEKAFDKERGK